MWYLFFWFSSVLESMIKCFIFLCEFYNCKAPNLWNFIKKMSIDKYLHLKYQKVKQNIIKIIKSIELESRSRSHNNIILKNRTFEILSIRESSYTFFLSHSLIISTYSSILVQRLLLLIPWIIHLLWSFYIFLCHVFWIKAINQSVNHFFFRCSIRLIAIVGIVFGYFLWSAFKMSLFRKDINVTVRSASSLVVTLWSVVESFLMGVHMLVLLILFLLYLIGMSKP